MKRLFNIFASLSLLNVAIVIGALPDIPDSDEGANLWKSNRQKTVETLHSQPNEIKIHQLGQMIRQLSTLGYRDRPEKDEIKELLQESLIAIPGHAVHYRDRILKAQELLKNRGDGPSYVDYRTEQRHGFQTLPHLPSSETVRVFGELLFNDWVPPGNETAPISERLPLLSVRSTAGLSKLPIKDKPFKDALTLANLADAQAAWRLWYEEIKSGKRTFRFEGDPTEYDLNGPAPGQKLTRIARDTARDAERAAGKKKNATDPAPAATASPGSESPSNAVAIAVSASGLVLLGALFWYFSRTSKLRAQ